ncbi:uncharacterized protein LOC134107922 [Pungitius pungitius]|uniref:uncharacterized protein LOC134107922 n=1 Tax=Pungitius pungitius TaxID=134920 RepID=UPI002E106E0E
MGPGGTDYCALMEALPETNNVGVARTLAVVRNGRIPVRVCNPYPYTLSIGRYQKLGKLYHIDEADVHGSHDLTLSLEDNGVVEVALVDATVDHKGQKLPEEVRNLTNRPDLSKPQQEELCTLLLKWKDAFANHDEDFGRTDLVQHRIHTGDAAPIRERYRPLPPLMYKEMKNLLAEMLEKGVIRESCSPWAAPIVLVKKKDGNWRFCVDYRKLNAVTHKDAFPLPRIEETLTNLTRAEWFSTLDLASGYWQVEMDPQDREKTAFTTPLGLFEFERMPFGLCNAPATFQRLMQQCLSGQMAESLLVYLDDIIIYSPDFSSHLQHLDEVIQRLLRHGLKLRLDKCKLLQQEVKFLGHVVDHSGTARLGAVEQRWVAQLASFNYDVKYRPGKSNANADALSRFPVDPIPTRVADQECETGASVTTAAIELTPRSEDSEWASSEWEDAQANDPDIKVAKRLLTSIPMKYASRWCVQAQGVKRSGKRSMKPLPMLVWIEHWPGYDSISIGLTWSKREEDEEDNEEDNNDSGSKVEEVEQEEEEEDEEDDGDDKGKDDDDNEMDDGGEDSGEEDNNNDGGVSEGGGRRGGR